MQVMHYRREASAPESNKILEMNQNNTTPKLELLVRESIQNSLDAAIPGSQFVKVGYKCGTFDRSSLSYYFPELKRTFDKVNNDYLCVYDYGTTGLTGPVKYSDLPPDAEFKGKYLSLVKGCMDTSKDSSSSGGRWGIGKTIYYILGMNLVIYYTRVKEEKGYASKLSAVWIDDGHRLYAPQQIKDWRGISIWGYRVSEEGFADDIIPTTDESEIQGILDCFALRPYAGEETGTMIIIPAIKQEYLDEPKTIGETYKIRPPWYGDLKEYLWMNIQKYYFPRLIGSENPNPKLYPLINDIPIFQMYPFFKHAQDIYNCTYSNKTDVVKTEEIHTTRRIKLGTFAYGQVSQTQLNHENSPFSPFDLCGLRNNEDPGNKPFILYTRDTGMISTYEDESIRTLNTPDDDVYYIGIFRLSPDAPYPDGDEFKTAEEYIREGEKSDHLGWRDIAEYRFKKIKSNLVTNLKQKLGKIQSDAIKNNKNNETKGNRTTLGRNIANCLFPINGTYLHKDSEQVSKGHHGLGKHGKNKVELKGYTARINSDSIKLSSDVLFHSCNAAIITIEMRDQSSRTKTTDYEKWSETLGCPYPISLESLIIDHYGPINDMNYEEAYITQESEKESPNVKLTKINPVTIKIETTGLSSSVHMTVSLSRPDVGFVPLLKVQEL